ncbi:poly-gamma-glutamate biosynthesis protein [Candidatus Epulonipiscium fishelsonii]|uniref:Poly-gamma-glutamate biosynthesis protein n=1 Tax=Candidatus Epulonipiscium fishelsonii TaxID=77094 RepID=A0ACC8X7V3_9FIRM|nr:poly-gamma-glutamate biosynthesis protein [Epulopiscium sp. SCG-B11WGA-EpuloA1]ONI40730.1 poly-gamma-glutamate biosynthesis protein [Epulopiscium sp. SCG-B05WGA-EpuloA1]
MNIIIGGDLVPTSSNYKFFEEGTITSLIGKDLSNILNKADIRIFNLEVPLSDKKMPIKKCGPNLIAPLSTIKGLKNLNPTLLTLANNHILDQGVQGLKSTIKVLKENNIPFIGVGKNNIEAHKPCIILKDNFKLGIYACAETEFTLATSNSAGANGFDPFESLDYINDLKSKCDYVIVLYHGGREHYRYPTPYLQKVCKKIVDKGADLVVCQHSHCIGAMEDYKNSKIIYGQGNFIFDHSEQECWQTSILIEINFDQKITIDYIPIKKINNKIRLAKNLEGTKILQEFYKRSQEITTINFIENNYKEYVLKEYYLIGKLLGYNRIQHKLNKILKNKLITYTHSPEKLLGLQNSLSCEPHRELLIKNLNLLNRR